MTQDREDLQGALSATRGLAPGWLGTHQRGASRSGLVLPFCPFSSFFVLLGLSRFFWDFPDLLGMVRGFSRFVTFLFLGLLRAPTRNSPERVRDTIWTFPEKVPWETPRFGNPPGSLLSIVVGVSTKSLGTSEIPTPRRNVEEQ